jgi:hypothetical protein
MARVGEAEAALVRRDHQTAGTRSVSGRSVRSLGRAAAHTYSGFLDRPPARSKARLSCDVARAAP